MDKKIAKLLLDNLLARIVVDPETGQKTLEGVLTLMEVEALEMASALLAEAEFFVDMPLVTPEPEPKTDLSSEPESKHEPEQEFEPEPVAEPEPEPELEQEQAQEPEPAPEIKLNLKSLQYDTPQKPDTKMCLDFGTAMSKAFASVIEDGELEDWMSLKLGHRASGGTSKDIYPVPSSLWISSDGKVYMGEKAIALSLQADDSEKRERFDSLKKELILGLKESSPFQQPMRPTLNPTDVPLSTGDVITLYLGYLTDMACAEMEEVYGSSRYVLRNFGLPSWPAERRAWGEKLLKTMLVKAQIVADTFHGQWTDGISVRDVKSVLGEIDRLDELPEYLVGQGITEPLAVGSSRLRQDEPFRGLVMVVDIGAGTSDLALFVVVENPERNIFNAFPIKDCNKSLPMAGDRLDTALQQMIILKSGITNHDPDFHYTIQHLRMQTRSLKEDLFREGRCTVNLKNGTRIVVELDDFLRQDSINRFRKSLTDIFEEVLANMKDGVAKHFGNDGLSVVLTGGGASLPMVKELASGTHSRNGVQIRKKEVSMVPDEYEGDAELAMVYPQLAVAIGGTMPVIIDEKDALEDFDIPRGQPVLGRAPITGNG